MAVPVAVVPQAQPLYVATPVAPTAAPVLLAYAPGEGKGRGKGKGKVHQFHEAPVDTLCASSISLPADRVELRDNVNYFGILAVPSTAGFPWVVARRYNEFCTLRDQLGPQARAFPGAPFPGKTVFGCTGSALEGRRIALELWLTRVIESPSSACRPWCTHLKAFLEAGRQPVGTPPHLNAPPGSPPSLVTPPFPAPTAPPAAAPEAEAAPPSSDVEDDSCILQIAIPEGVTPGMQLGVNVPDGRLLYFTVPEGTAAGTQLHLACDPGSDHLTPVAI